MKTVLLMALLIAAVLPAFAQAPPGTPPEERQQEKDLIARIKRKQSDAQAFWQHYQITLRREGPGSATAGAYKQDAANAMEERNQAEFTLCQMYLQQGRKDEATGRLLDLGRRGVKAAIDLYNDLEYDAANTLYAESQQAAIDGKETLAKSKEKSAIEKLWRLHRSGYKRATDTLKALDKL